MVTNEDVPIDEVNARRVAEAIAATSQSAAEIVRVHEVEHGEVLPTLLLDLIGQWFVDVVGLDENARRAAEAVADLFEHGDDDVQTIVATGFLEAMPQLAERGRVAVERLPPPLRGELRRMEN